MSAAVAAGLLLTAHVCLAEQASIPESDVTALREELARAGRQTSTVGVRRDLKGVVRTGQALLQASPEAENRYVVLGLMLESQKRILATENVARNRDALFDTCGLLANAPDEYAELRLEADLLLSEKQLSDRNATLNERAQALAELIERYRGTAAEAKSLLMGAMIVVKLEAPELEDSILDALDERFSDDPDVIEFRRKHLKATRLDVSFKGIFTRSDGTALSFPGDTMGHMVLAVFWSQNTPGVAAYLDRTKAQMAPYSNLVDVFSFNVDELGDGGESILREKGLDWTVMRLPGGRNSQAYRTYAQGDPASLLVNEYGYAVIHPEDLHSPSANIDSARISEDRYVAQLQSVFIGDFLLADSADKLAALLPGEAFRGIRACFPPPPFRYRLSRGEALANYRKAERLCADAIRETPGAPNTWRLRQCRIIALLGVWNMACDPAALDAAVAEAEAALAAALPAEAVVIPRFCLAKAALRREDVEAEAVVARFAADTVGPDASASASALAAAAVLALDARSRDLHETFRTRFLAVGGEDPDFYAFAAFLRNRNHRHRLLKPNYSRRERSTRQYIVNLGGEATTNRMPKITLRSPDGSVMALPRDNPDRLTLLLFVEPPAGPAGDFPVARDRAGKPTGSDPIRSVMGYAQGLADLHIHTNVDVVAAFLCDDPDRVRALVKTNGWTCRAAMVPGELANPMVRQLGVLSADRIPNIFLLRRDGSVAWSESGLWYNGEFGYPYALLLAMKVHIEECEVEHAYTLLAAGKFAEAGRTFSGPFPPAQPDRYGWRSPRYHGKALASMGMGDWESARESIDIAIDAHKMAHFRGRESKDLKDWRKDAATVVMKEPCDILADLWATQATILDSLGRKEEADALRELAAKPAKPDVQNVYGRFHERLKSWRLSKTQEKATP